MRLLTQSCFFPSIIPLVKVDLDGLNNGRQDWAISGKPASLSRDSSVCAAW